MKKLLAFLISSLLILSSCSEKKLSKLEKQYIDELHQWIKSGGNKNTVQSVVQQNCSKLTMLMATKKENLSFLDHSNIKEYDFRVGFCMSAVLENIWANQPGFTKKFKNQVCREKIRFIQTVCDEFIKL